MFRDRREPDQGSEITHTPESLYSLFQRVESDLTDCYDSMSALLDEINEEYWNHQPVVEYISSVANNPMISTSQVNAKYKETLDALKSISNSTKDRYTLLDRQRKALREELTSLTIGNRTINSSVLRRTFTAELGEEYDRLRKFATEGNNAIHQNLHKKLSGLMELPKLLDKTYKEYTESNVHNQRSREKAESIDQNVSAIWGYIQENLDPEVLQRIQNADFDRSSLKRTSRHFKGHSGFVELHVVQAMITRCQERGYSQFIPSPTAVDYFLTSDTSPSSDIAKLVTIYNTARSQQR